MQSLKLQCVLRTSESNFNRGRTEASSSDTKLNSRLQDAEGYKDELIAKLQKHDLTKLSLTTSERYEKIINDETESYLLILSSLLLSSCSVFNTPEKEVVTVTEIVRPQITVAEKPKSLKLTDVKCTLSIEIILMSSRNMRKRNVDLVFYVISVRDYEKLALNMLR